MTTYQDIECLRTVWLLRAAGANLANVHDLTVSHDGAPFLLSADTTHEGSIGQLRALVDETGAKLVIVDPIMAVIGWGTITTNLGARRVLAPLQRLAKETGAAVVLTHHTVKSGSIAGSKGLIDALRIVYRIRKDPENAAVRVMTLEKSNVLSDVSDLRYGLAGEGHATHVEWLDRTDLAAKRTAWRPPAMSAVTLPRPANLVEARSRLASLRRG